MHDPIILTRADAPAALKIVGEELTILASGEQTGSYEIFRQAGPEGSGPPPHSHAWDEAFYITEGSLHIGVGDEVSVATAGTLVHVPGGTVHWFAFGEGGGEMLSMTSRAGASAFFTQAAAEISPSEPDLGALVAIASAHGVEVAVPS